MRLPGASLVAIVKAGVGDGMGFSSFTKMAVVNFKSIMNSKDGSRADRGGDSKFSFLHLFFFLEGWLRTPAGDAASYLLSRSSCRVFPPVLRGLSSLFATWPQWSVSMWPPRLLAGAVYPPLANAQNQGQDLFRCFFGTDFLLL